jgi:N-acetylmuramoyl-L-alanine amidase
MMLLLLLGLWMGLTNPDSTNYLYYFQAEAMAGDGALSMLKRYHLEGSNCNLDQFYQLNKLTTASPLYSGKKYYLPILIYRYNGKSIRTTIGDPDYQKAVRIQNYNGRLLSKNLRNQTYQSSNILWVPYEELYCEAIVGGGPVTKEPKTLHKPIFGKKHSSVSIKSNALQGKVFYLMAGHGGPDPGALGQKGNHRLCEDEYAYDVTLRLYKLLLEQGARAYMIIQDQNDGIRDDQILPCDKDETCGGKALPLNQLKRLNQRIIQVNQLYRKHKSQGVKDQVCLSIHVDSRSVHKRQDVFFCHYPKSNSSKALAKKLQHTFKTKYRQHRSNGNYEGTVEERNLYVLKNTLSPAVLVELANIQNSKDHQRFLLPSNRQALANWLLEGLMAK